MTYLRQVVLNSCVAPTSAALPPRPQNPTRPSWLLHTFPRNLLPPLIRNLAHQGRAPMSPFRVTPVRSIRELHSRKDHTGRLLLPQRLVTVTYFPSSTVQQVGRPTCLFLPYIPPSRFSMSALPVQQESFCWRRSKNFPPLFLVPSSSPVLREHDSSVSTLEMCTLLFSPQSVC